MIDETRTIALKTPCRGILSEIAIFRQLTHRSVPFATIQGKPWRLGVYFPDLSPYSYATKFSLPKVLNVGWLDRSMPYSRGTVPSGFSDQLDSPHQIHTSFNKPHLHECNFCRPDQWPLLPLEENPAVTVGGERRLPDLDHSKLAVLNSLGSPGSRPGL